VKKKNEFENVVTAVVVAKRRRFKLSIFFLSSLSTAHIIKNTHKNTKAGYKYINLASLSPFSFLSLSLFARQRETERETERETKSDVFFSGSEGRTEASV
jgi:hypothetical protein